MFCWYYAGTRVEEVVFLFVFNVKRSKKFWTDLSLTHQRKQLFLFQLNFGSNLVRLIFDFSMHFFIHDFCFKTQYRFIWCFGLTASTAIIEHGRLQTIQDDGAVLLSFSSTVVPFWLYNRDQNRCWLPNTRLKHSPNFSTQILVVIG